jgi:hypothetical protein
MMEEYIKAEARQICKDLFEQMVEIDTQDWFSLDDHNYGFRIDKDAANKYSVRIAGDGIHYSKALKGLRPHILKKIEQVLNIKARMENNNE